jgi:type I restriction enzyme S subunit
MFYKETNFKDTLIGKIPKDWEIVNLGNVIMDIGDGGTPSTKIKEYFQGNIPWVNIEDIRKDIHDTRRHLSESGLKHSSAKLWPEGTIIFSFGASIGKVGIARVKLCTKQGIAGIVPDPHRINNEFLYYVLLKQSKKIKKIGKGMGSTITEIRPSKLVKLVVFPLPSPLEQQNIAKILSTVDHAIEKVDEVIAKTERLKKGLMHELLTKGIGHKEFKETEIGKIPKTWQITTIGEKCEVGTGGTPSRKHHEYFNGRIPWVKSTEVDYNIITKTEEHITELGLQNSNAKVYPAGTLIIAMYGQGVTRGKCAILGIDAAVNQACAAITPKEPDCLHIPYLYYWCQFKYEQIRSLAQGANQSNLNLSLIRSIKIALPPVLEQQEIAETLYTIDEKLEIDKKEKEKLEKIKQSLMDLLLAGKIRVKVN